MKFAVNCFILNIKRQLVYKVNFIGNSLLTLVFYLFQFIFLGQLLQFKPDFANSDPEYLLFIFFVFSIMSLMIGIFSSSIYRFFKTVAEGGIEPFLIKPVPLYALILLRWMKPINIVLIAIITLFIFLTTEIFSFEASVIQWVEFLLALLSCFILNLLFIFGLNLFTIMTQRFLPIDYIHEEIFNLSIIPLSLFPSQVINWLTVALPIALSASLPVAILYNEQSGTTLLVLLLLSTSIAFIIVIYAFKKHCVILMA